MSKSRFTPSKVPGMFWPLIGAFIAFVLFAVLMGWIMDAPNRQRR